MHVKGAYVYIPLCSAETAKINLYGFSIHVALRSGAEIGSFSNDEGDGNENSKNVTMFNLQNNNFAFLCRRYTTTS